MKLAFTIAALIIYALGWVSLAANLSAQQFAIFLGAYIVFKGEFSFVIKE